MAAIPVTAAAENLEQRATRLLARWRQETAYLSSSTRITAHPAYQELIALGTPALPFLFRDLEQTKDGHLSKALATVGYTRCSSEEHEHGFEKVALFARGRVPMHAARQLPGGRWTSKLGLSEDMEHDLHAVSGEMDGPVAIVLKRPVR